MRVDQTVSPAAVPPPLAAAAARAADQARARAGTRRAAIFWGGPAGLTCIATAGEGGGEGWVGQTLPAGVGMAGRAVAEDRPVWSPDLLTDPRVPIAAWLRERLEAEGLRSVAAAPIRVAGVARGALGLLDGLARVFDDAALRGLSTLADETARELARALDADAAGGTGA